MPRRLGRPVGRSQDSVAGLASPTESGIALPDAVRPSRFGLVSQAKTSGSIENMVRDELLERFRHYAKQMTLFDKRLEGDAARFPRGSLTGHPRHRPVFGVLIVAEIGEVERFRSAKQVGCLLRPHLSRSSIRRTLLPRLHHAARLSLAALGFGAGRHEGGSPGRRLEKLLQPHTQTIQREDLHRVAAAGNWRRFVGNACGAGNGTRPPGRLKNHVVSPHRHGCVWPAKGTSGSHFRCQ